MNYKRLFYAFIFLLAFVACAAAQNPSAAKRINYGAALPATCDPSSGEVFIKTGVSPTEFYWCSATNTWTELDAAGGGGGGASALDDLSDVTLGTPAAGEYLRYNGTAWVDGVIQAGDLPTGIDAAKLADGSVSNTEFQRLDGVTSGIQSQIDGKQAADSDLTAVAGLSSNGLVARTGAGTAAARTITGTTNQVTVTNGDGASGNPTLSLPQSICTGCDVQFNTLGVNTSTPSNINGVTFSNVRAQVFNSASSAYLAITTSNAGGYAGLMLNRGGASANLRNWAMEAQPISSNTDTQFAISTYSDAGFPTGILTLTRAGALSVTGTVEGASLSLGGGITWTKGAGAPAGACTSGSLYTNTTTGALSVCESAVWITK